jgi:hypothetical protein
MTSLIWLGIFALIALPVMLLFWISDSFQNAKRYRELPPEQKRSVRENNAEIAKRATKEMFTPTIKLGLLLLAAIVLIIAISNQYR